jgi:hypothetical protein
MLRSQRRLSNPQKAKTVEVGLGGLHMSQIMDVIEKNHGGPECTRFIIIYNFFCKTQEGKNQRQGCSECPNLYESHD